MQFTIPTIPTCPNCGQSDVSPAHIYGHQAAGKPKKFSAAELARKTERLAKARKTLAILRSRKKSKKGVDA